MQVKVKKGDVIWSYLSIFTSLTSNIIIMPLVVYYLTGEMMGLWYVYGSIGAIAHLFDFGFTVTFARNITYCWSGASRLNKVGGVVSAHHEPDFKLMNNILQVCRYIYMIIAFVILILMLTVGSWYILHITEHIDGYTPIVSWVCYTLGVFLNMYFNYFDSFLRGVGAVKYASRNRTIAKLTQIILMAIFLVSGLGIIGISIAYIIFGFVFRLLCKHDFYQYQNIGERLKEVKEKISRQMFKDLFVTIWFNAWREGLVQLSFYCTEQVSVIICSMYLSLTETGVYSLGLQIATAVSTISAALYSTYQPTLQSAYIQGDREKMINGMSIIVFSFTTLLTLGSVGTIFVGLPILRMIKPEAVLSGLMMLGIFINQFILKLRNCYSSYFSCTNRIIYMKSFISSAMLCLALSLLFMGNFKFGVWGLILAQILSQLVFNAWYWPLKAHHELKISMLNVWLNGGRLLLKKFKLIKN